MPQFIALLRGINVGKAKRVPMAELRDLLTSLGYANVQTLLNSGNVVFESAGRATTSAQAKQIQTAIAETMNVEVPVIVKSSAEFALIETECTITNSAKGTIDPSRLLVAFAQDTKTLAELSPLSALVHESERFQIGKYAAYLYCANGILESKAGAALLGKVGRSVTTRNWATVLKITQLLETK